VMEYQVTMFSGLKG